MFNPELDGEFGSVKEASLSQARNDTMVSHLVGAPAAAQPSIASMPDATIQEILREEEIKRLRRKQKRIQNKLRRLAAEGAAQKPAKTSVKIEPTEQAEPMDQMEQMEQIKQDVQNLAEHPQLDQEDELESEQSFGQGDQEAEFGQGSDPEEAEESHIEAGKQIQAREPITVEHQTDQTDANTPRKKRRVLLVPMDPQYKRKVSHLLSARDQEETPLEINQQDASETMQVYESEPSDSEQEYSTSPPNPPVVSPHDLTIVKTTVRDQINGNRLPQLPPSLEAPYKQVTTLFTDTVSSSESHTAFLMGPSGIGKTTVVRKAVSDLQRKYPKTFIVIRLSGDLHRSDHAAIREFARQLDMQVKGLSAVVSEDAFEQRSISDTFNNILTALERLDVQHKRRFNEEKQRRHEYEMDHPVKKSAKDKKEEKKSDQVRQTIRLLIIIDKIDAYTHTPRQTLLYNLLDLCQSSQIPMCLLGITQNLAIRENLEKRVRSRFSQRIIEIKKAKTLDTFWKNARPFLTVDTDEASELMYDDAKFPKAWNNHLDESFYAKTETGSGLRSLVEEIFAATKSYKHLLNGCLLAIRDMSIYEPFPKPEMFDAAYRNLLEDNVNGQIASLSEAEQLLLISAARWSAKSESKQVNFKLAYKEYAAMVKSANLEATTLTSKTSSIDNLSLAGIKVTKSILTPKALKDSWATLYRYGLLLDIITSNSEVNAQNNHNRNMEMHIAEDKMLLVDVSLEELVRAVPDNLKRYTKL